MNMINSNKVVQLVVSERGDFWIEELPVAEDETLRQALQKRGFTQFNKEETVDLDESTEVRDGMRLRIRLP